ncbi:hypothetical protein FRB90_012203 [Tulasnella sp. 427]|nr:hypothetical protein FRB90_012203 [Tulasnella sp. 427]
MRRHEEPPSNVQRLLLKMNRLWTIPELVTMVFDSLESSDLARLARVCRQLWECAIPLLWKEPFGPNPLFRIWSMEQRKQLVMKQSDKGRVQSDESASFPRLHLYGQHIRTITLELDQLPHTDSPLHIDRGPLKSSLSNLKTLDVFGEPVLDLALAELVREVFYQPTITSLGLFSSETDSDSDSDFGALLPDKPFTYLIMAITDAQFANLESLTIKTSIDTMELSCVVDAVRLHKGLMVVKVETMNDDTIELQEALANLPKLQSLRLKQLRTPPKSKAPPPMTTAGFPSLIQLSLDATPSHLHRVMLSIESKALTEAKIVVLQSEPHIDSRLGMLFEGLTRFQLLRTVNLRLMVDFVWEQVAPVLLCGELRKFSLTSAYGVSSPPITKAHLLVMGKAWPNLVELTITDAYKPVDSVPLIKLADLFDITKAMQYLQRLCISFDARRKGQEHVFAILQDGKECQASNVLTSINVTSSLKDSGMEASDALSKLFLLWWPSLKVQPHSPNELASQRLLLHARLLQTLDFRLTSKSHSIVKDLLEIPSFNENLIKLRSLLFETFFYDTDNATDVFATFYTPRLTRLSITADSTHNLADRSDQLFRGLLKAVATSYLPAIRSLELRVGSRCYNFESGALESTLITHQGLQFIRLELETFTQGMLRTLKSLPELQSLSLRFNNPRGQQGNFSSFYPGTPKGFLRLTDLTLQCGPAATRQLLQLIDAEQLQVLRASMAPEDRIGHPVDGVILEGALRFTKLRELSLRSSVNFTWEDIEPALSCREMTRFSLVWHLRRRYILDDPMHLDAMAEAWPRLSDLTLGHAEYVTCYAGPSAVNLADVRRLTDKLPSLRRLTLSFDARRAGQEEVFALSTTESIYPSESRLEYLNVGLSDKDSDPDTENELAQIVTSWWPNLREFGAAEAARPAWANVAELVRCAVGAKMWQ